MVQAGTTLVASAFGLTISQANAAEPETFVQKSLASAGPGNGKLLVVYSSMFGSTGQVAVTVGEELSKAGYAVDVRMPQKVQSIDGYAAVVIGSCIRGSAWLEEAADFVRANRKPLSKVPVAYFLTCMRLSGGNDASSQAETRSWLDPVVKEIPEVKPVSIGAFAGAIHFDKLSLVQKVVYPIIAGNMMEGDFRDFNKIRTWAGSLRAPLGI